MKRIILLILAICVGTSAFAQSSDTPVAKLKEIKGEVEVKREGGDWGKAVRETTLNLGDFIRTDKKSKATLEIRNIDEIIRITLDEETESSVKNLLINPLTGKQDSGLGLDRGHIKVSTKKFHKGTSFKTETPNAVVELDEYGLVVKYKEKTPE